MTLPIPDKIEEINADWLGQVLRSQSMIDPDVFSAVHSPIGFAYAIEIVAAAPLAFCTSLPRTIRLATAWHPGQHIACSLPPIMMQ